MCRIEGTELFPKSDVSEIMAHLNNLLSSQKEITIQKYIQNPESFKVRYKKSSGFSVFRYKNNKIKKVIN